eukprot:m.15379 g.15379  ORF g.15379 m.15379 type:complete len:53 (-) comp7841_c0_seq4:1175-1333(-)
MTILGEMHALAFANKSNVLQSQATHACVGVMKLKNINVLVIDSCQSHSLYKR